MRKPPRRGTSFGRPPAKPKPAPAPRNYPFEKLLCEAIAKLQQVELKYEDDPQFRIFDPYAVYLSASGKILVSGTQVKDPNDPVDQFEPHNFEVGKIAALRLRTGNFVRDPRFDPFADKYKKGFICRVK